MPELVVTALLVAVVLAIGAAAASYRRFATLRSRFVEHLAAEAPEVSVAALTSTGLRVRVLGTSMDVDLATLARRRPRGGGDRVWLDRILAGIRSSVPIPDAPPFSLVQDRILPQLKPAGYVALLEQYPERVRPVSRPLVPGVVVTYVVSGIHHFTAVTRGSLTTWGQPPDRLHELALANLRARTAHMLEEIGGPQQRYEHLDGLDATRILVADMIVPGAVTDPLVAIPEETVLLIAPATERATLAAEAETRHASSTRPLSPDVFAPTPAGPVPRPAAGINRAPDV
jgi:hypothetical protein